MAMNQTPRMETAGSKRALDPTDEELLEIQMALRGLRYGSLHIVVQDGVVVQIDRTEKRRLRTGERGA